MGKSVCILVVDDHVDSLRAVARLLQMNGYTVHTARTAEEAKALAAERPCDLVIGDIGLPDQDGCELMRELREAHALKGIAVTGYTERKDVKDALASGPWSTRTSWRRWKSWRASRRRAVR